MNLADIFLKTLEENSSNQRTSTAHFAEKELEKLQNNKNESDNDTNDSSPSASTKKESNNPKETIRSDFMSSTNLKINKNCNQCGSCLGCDYKFLSTAKDGSIIVAPGTILKKDGTEYKTLQDICPVNAFELDAATDSDKVLKELISKLKNHTGIPVPTQNDVKFNKNDYFISLPYSSNEYEYDYSSSNAAERAALREFERLMYSQIDSIMLKIITEYRTQKIKPYYVGSIEQGSVYAKNNQYLSELLRGINNALGNKLPSDFAVVEVLPDRDILDMWKMLNRGELIAEDFISTVRSEFSYSASDYSCKWRTDDMEMYEGTDFFGNSKYKYKHCYCNLNDAFEELADDIMNSFDWASDDIEERALDKVSYLVGIYNDRIKELISTKLKQIEKYHKI